MTAIITLVIFFQATADDQLLCGQLLGSVGAIDPAYFTGQAFDGLGLGFRVHGLGFGVHGLGFRV